MFILDMFSDDICSDNDNGDDIDYYGGDNKHNIPLYR